MTVKVPFVGLYAQYVIMRSEIELLVGWDNVPMGRWARSQMFRSLDRVTA